MDFLYLTVGESENKKRDINFYFRLNNDGVYSMLYHEETNTYLTTSVQWLRTITLLDRFYLTVSVIPNLYFML